MIRAKAGHRIAALKLKLLVNKGLIQEAPKMTTSTSRRPIANGLLGYIQTPGIMPSEKC